MLRLEKLQISGFKSFSDRTEVDFPRGITAVVGPNGCGKSNLGDAINWVLGEQSPKMLRGRQMADVIFGGSRARKPLGMAEVSLFFGGAEGLEGADQGNAVVTRRLFRSGESEYQLNGSRVRLKDVQALLREARVGARSYATIEQGRIDQVLNAKPKERRLLIEDAAGIAGYKHKRRLTELKLEATQANVLRVNDIISEVRRQINALKRQAAKARRYKRLRDELRDCEGVRFALRAREMDSELARCLEAERAARDAEARAAAELARLEVEVTAQRDALEEANRSYRELSERVHRLELEIDREEVQARSCKERIAESEAGAVRQTAAADGLATKLEATEQQLRDQQTMVGTHTAELEQQRRALVEDRTGLGEAEQRYEAERDAIEGLRKEQFESMHRTAELGNRIRVLEEALERAGRTRSRLEAERVAAEEDRSRLEQNATALAAESETHAARLEELQARFSTAEAELSRARERDTRESRTLAASRETAKSVAAELRTLEDVGTRFAGVSDGVRMLMASGPSAGVQPLGVVADFIEAASDVETAAEGYLKWFLPTVILEGDADVGKAVDLLRSAGAGRTTFISRSQPTGGLAVGSPQNGKATLPPEILADSRVLGRLRDRVHLKSSLNGEVQDRIGDAVLVDSLQSALDLHRRFPGADYLTPDGAVVYASGVISVGGQPNGDQGLLAHQRRIREAQDHLARASVLAEQLESQVGDSRERLERLETEIVNGRQALEEARGRGLELDLERRKSEEERHRARRQAQVLADELASCGEETQRLETSLEESKTELEQAQTSHKSIEQELERRSAGLQEQQRRLKESGEQMASLRADLAAKEQRHAALDGEAARLAELHAELRARVDGLREQAEAESGRAREAANLQQRTEADLVTHLEERRTLTEQARKLEQDTEERQRGLAERDERLRGDRTRQESVRESTRTAEVERTRAEAARDHLDDLCRQELGISAEQATAAAGAAVEGQELGTLDSTIEDLKQKLERIGAVNLTAIEEFSELEERDGFLSAQAEDLDKSMTSLRETIRRINRQSRERFLQAFEAISQSYQEVFKLLFNGGRASLRLEEGEDVLECGIEIMAQPPGKRLSNVALLSGGEKALSAISLLFAIFRFQPSPFCLLDEVDAALDEANVGRFARLLREYSEQTQFILITHNKMSMESADLLYGVTMEEPGVSRVISLQLQ